MEKPKSLDKTVETIALILDCLQDAQQLAQTVPGNNWPLRKKLLECAQEMIEAKRMALITAAGRISS